MAKIDELLGIEWIGRQIVNKAKADVTVKIVNNGMGNQKISITFRNDCYKKFTSTEHMMCAIHKNRILFKESSDFNGITLCENASAKANSRYARFGNLELSNLFRQFEGNYELKFDDIYDIYYIEKEEEKE